MAKIKKLSKRPSVAKRQALSKKRPTLSKGGNTFAQIEKILGGVIEHGPHAKIDKLLAAAKRDKDNPAYHLVAVMVAAFARDNHLDAKAYLEEAQDRLVGANSRDPEMAFSAALYRVIQAELGLYQMAKSGRANPHAQQTLLKRSAAGTKQLAAAAKPLKQPMANLIVSCMQTMSQASSTRGSTYRNGLKTLERQTKSGNLRDMAGFFLHYAHRRNHNYKGALAAAHAMEKRQPNSSMLKKMIGSCYQYSGDSEKAVNYFKQATTLAPKDPSAHHGLSRAYLAAAARADMIVDHNDPKQEFKDLHFKVPR